MASQAKTPFLDLDTIASWGKFPRFCINTYRWGDKFFNNYDSTYVQGSGYRFNVKIKSDSYVDVYDYRLSDNTKIGFESRPSTSLGLWLTYMAVSIGYDMNVSKYFHADAGAKKRFNLQFNCALFAFEYYNTNNDSHMKINRIGKPGEIRHTDIPFHGFHSDDWGFNVYYFFNHRHYSQAAAFSYSKIQQRSSGSLYAGISYWHRNFDLDFTGIFEGTPEEQFIPEGWDYHYSASHDNYAIKIGYGYNWVFHPGWCLAISEAPTIGIRKGYIGSPDNTRTTFGVSNRFRCSLVYNHDRRWFFGIVGLADTNLIYNRMHTFLAHNLSIEASAGFRFNLW